MFSFKSLLFCTPHLIQDHGDRYTIAEAVHNAHMGRVGRRHETDACTHGGQSVQTVPHIGCPEHLLRVYALVIDPTNQTIVRTTMRRSLQPNTVVSISNSHCRSKLHSKVMFDDGYNDLCNKHGHTRRLKSLLSSCHIRDRKVVALATTECHADVPTNAKLHWTHGPVLHQDSLFWFRVTGRLGNRRGHGRCLQRNRIHRFRVRGAYRVP